MQKTNWPNTHCLFNGFILFCAELDPTRKFQANLLSIFLYCIYVKKSYNLTKNEFALLKMYLCICFTAIIIISKKRYLLKFGAVFPFTHGCVLYIVRSRVIFLASFLTKKENIIIIKFNDYAVKYRNNWIRQIEKVNQYRLIRHSILEIEL